MEEHEFGAGARDRAEGGEARLRVRVAARTNYACHLNDVPLVAELAVEHEGVDPIEGATIRLAAEPPFVTPRVWTLDRIEPGTTFPVEETAVEIDPGFLWRVRETVPARLEFVLEAGGRTLDRIACEVEVQPRSHWSGCEGVPEILAAFSMPNDPAVDRILGRACEHLRRSGHDPALRAYSDDDRARIAREIAAILAAAAELGIAYALPPRGFERSGQKIRSPSQVVDAKVGTCLDTTMLLCSCLEQAGYHPIVVLRRDHALCGVWTCDETFPTVLVDDPAALRKRIRLGEILVFETTALREGRRVAVEDLIRQGREQLEPSKDATFEAALCVRRARMQRIRPLPALEGDAPPVLETGRTAVPEEVPAAGVQAPSLPEPVAVEPPRRAETPAERIERWQRRLLDLTLRNRLLHFRETRRSVRLLCSDPGRLEDLLASGRSVRLAPLPPELAGESARSPVLHRERTGEDLMLAAEREALERGEALVALGREEMERRLVEILRAARAALQEGGSNVLHLALGFLKWRRRGEKRDLLAPLLLLPVRLERRTARSAFRLALLEEEPRVNPTLLELLAQDFGVTIPELSGPLPADESGLDVPRIWRLVDHAVKDLEGFEVLERTYLAPFSFAKYLMWKDLVERADRLKENPVVAHLVDNPRGVYADGRGLPEPSGLDERYGPSHLLAPLPADSSQLAAVAAAAGGADFVLVGPPGTGKSQTIANLIAHAVASGSSVLFVSEKTAALEVVRRRLDQIGLGDHCLELHSTRASKGAVYEQLRRAWEAVEAEPPEGWREAAERLARLRARLNAFVDRLHCVWPNGWSAWEAASLLLAEEGAPLLRLDCGSPAEHDAGTVERLRGLAADLEALLEPIGQVAGHPLSFLGPAEWSPRREEEIVEAARLLAESARAFERARDEFLSWLGAEAPASDRASNRRLVELAEALERERGAGVGAALAEGGERVVESASALAGLLEEAEEVRERLAGDYPRDVFDRLDLEALRESWLEADRAFFLRAFFLRRRVKRALERAAGRRLDEPFEELLVLRRLAALGEEIETAARPDPTAARAGRELVWEEVAPWRRRAESMLALRKAWIRALPAASAEARSLAARWLDGADAGEGGRIAGLLRAADELRQAIETFAQAAAVDTESIAADAADEIGELSSYHDALVEHRSRVRPWLRYLECARECAEAGIGALGEAVRDGDIAPDAVVRAFETSYARLFLDAVLERDEVLRRFSASLFERDVERFVRLDEEFRELTRREILARVASRIADPLSIPEEGGWGLLRRELRKKTRRLPVRRLVEAAPDVLRRLTPCVMMSPLSIAQYLPADHSLFDLVVFDEASQIPVWDAIGAIARGRQVVVVGDPKQLPPTSFFERQSGGDEEADPEIDQDLESILDELNGAGVPTLHLDWHYRSRHESLITFSNRRYYEGRLVTLPSPLAEDRAVRRIDVPDGVYEKGGARVNRREAEEVVRAAVALLTDEAFSARGESLGIVTFNLEQQRLVEDLLDEERRRRPEIERHFTDEVAEPVFVKNLESVQGDERDVVLFSVTYGPDKEGRVSMNFGPLNRAGGERRLNVAITRARRELVVFSTLRPEHIDLTRTRARGVADLKSFLEYAERGPAAIGGSARAAAEGGEEGAEGALARRLRAKGWQVERGVGSSAGGVDLAVRDPDDPSRFLAGVLLDGRRYRRAPTARDREIVRPSVLRSLGWELLRAYTLEVRQDPDGVAERIHERLVRLREQRRAEAAQEPSDAQGREPTAEEEPASKASAAPAVEFAAYEIAELGPFDADSFYEDDGAIERLVEEVVRVEGPVLEDVVTRRIARAYGFGRIGRVIRERIERATSRWPRELVSHELEGRVLWPRGVPPREVVPFRAPRPGDIRRGLDELPGPELRGLAQAVLARGLSGRRAENEMGRLVGLRRIPDAVRHRFRHLLESVARAEGREG